MLRAVIGPKGQDRAGRSLAQIDAIDLCLFVSYFEKVFDQPPIEACLLSREERRQRIMRGLTDRRLDGKRPAGGPNTGVAFVITNNGVDRVEHRDVNDSHGATGAAGSELLAKDAQFAGRHRCVIKPAGVNRDRVPAMNGVERIFWRQRVACRPRAIEARAKEITEAQRTRVVAET